MFIQVGGVGTWTRERDIAPCALWKLVLHLSKEEKLQNLVPPLSFYNSDGGMVGQTLVRLATLNLVVVA